MTPGTSPDRSPRRFDQPRYTLTLEALPERLERPPAVRVRQLLKLALRVFGLRCVSIRCSEEKGDADERG